MKKFIFLFFPLISFSQLSEKVNILFSELNTFQRVESEHISFGGVQSNAYKIYKEIDSIATTSELVYMVKNGNIISKTYLSKTLVDRKYDKIVELFKFFLSNDEHFEVTIGCLSTESTLAGELYSYLINEKSKIEIRKEIEIEISKNPLEYLNFPIEDYHSYWEYDAILKTINKINKVALNHNNINPHTISIILRLNSYKFDDYKKIKRIALKIPNRETLTTLANFKNENDVDFILQNEKINFLAISKFPHSSFFSYLQESCENQYQNLDFYDAITSYCTKESGLELEKLYNKIILENKKFPMLGDELLVYLLNFIEDKKCSEHNDFFVKLNDYLTPNSP